MGAVSDEFDVVIAGAGVAGLTAGLTSARLGRKTLVLTGGVPGGLLLSIDRVDGMPGFPGGVAGYELCPLVQEQAVEAGAELSMAEALSLEHVDDRWRVTTGDGTIEAGGVIVATGARIRDLGVPGESRLRGRGVSHCASCDAPLLRDRPVAVVGGGDSALQEALALAETVSSVIVLQRETALSAQERYRRAALEHPKIEIRLGIAVEEILGTEGVTGLRTRVHVTDAIEEHTVAAVFGYIGLKPNTEFLGGQIDLDPTGRIPTDSWMQATLPGLFAAGIVRSGTAGRAAASAGDGAAAAITAHEYLIERSRRSPSARAFARSRGNGGAGG